MTSPHDTRNSPSLAELQNTLEAAFAARRIVSVRRSESPYRSSFPLDELTVEFDDGTQRKLIFKNTAPYSLPEAARRAKPEFLDDPLREIELYRHVLDPHELGTAVCYASVADPAALRYWLFLERVAGRELYQVGEFELWRAAARWLARLHRRFANPASVPPHVRARLIHYDAAYYERWLERAISFTGHPRLRELAGEYPWFVGELLALPPTLIHGEFYASNVLVESKWRKLPACDLPASRMLTPPPPRICAVDWERAGWGPGWIDVAALTAGQWTEAEKTELVREYLAELHSLGESPPAVDSLRGWHLCRLHQAVQWLGWSSDWTPPREHQQDWLAEVAASADHLRNRFEERL